MALIDQIIVVVYLLAMVGVGLYFQKKASSGIDSYFLGDRKLPWWALGASGMSSNLDVAGTMMLTGFVYTLGVNGFWLEIRGSVGLYYVFIMIFMGKWCRRSKVMTSAEWMTYRFGDGLDGKIARLISALSALVFTIAMVAFFSKGAGKFVAELLNVPNYLGVASDFWAALAMIILAMIYTVSSGIQGVVWTDVLQGVLIFVVIGVVSVMAINDYQLPDQFKITAAVDSAKVTGLALNQAVDVEGKYILRKKQQKHYLEWQTSKDEWTSIAPETSFDFPQMSHFSIFNVFAFTLFFYFMKVFLDGFSGAGGYVFQRLLAAKDEKEVGLMMLAWIILSSFRWPLIIALAMMGVYLSAQSGISDPDLVLPLVINKMVPVGLKGVLVAGLIAAAMSTFDSTVNNGASYWVKDIYQAHIRPNASEKALIVQSRWASVVIVALALLLSLSVTHLAELWSWIAISLSAGLFVPMISRWYWWRLNGWGFAAGVFVGLTVGLLQKMYMPSGTPEYYAFIFSSALSLCATVVVTYLTAPIDQKVLENFYMTTRPFGLWGVIKSRQEKSFIKEVHREHCSDLLAVLVAIPWMLSLYLMWMSVVVKNWTQFILLLFVFVVTSFLLKKTWFNNLKKT